MGKRFFAGIVFRIVLITAAATHFAFSVVRSPSLFDPIVAVSFVVLLFSSWWLFSYIIRSNVRLGNILFSIKERDFVDTVAVDNRENSAHFLGNSLNAIVAEFQKMNFEKESYYRMLDVLNETIQVGIISVDETGTVRTINAAARQTLGTTSLRDVKGIKDIDEAFYRQLVNLKPEEKKVARLTRLNRSDDLLLELKLIRMAGQSLRIFFMHNISNELEEKELGAWQQVLEVLTHEIMNSVTPMVSLTSAINRMLRRPDGSRHDLATLPPDRLDDIFEGLETAQARGKSLIEFLNAYRHFAHTPQVGPVETDLTALVRSTVALMQPEFEGADVTVQFRSYPDPILLNVDPVLIEQVIINILKNALEAVLERADGRRIRVDLSQVTGSTTVSITDNGMGMDEETLSRAFIPFFTTKAKGTGIGLSLSRQIVRLHDGTINIESRFGEGTTVRVRF